MKTEFYIIDIDKRILEGGKSSRKSKQEEEWLTPGKVVLGVLFPFILLAVFWCTEMVANIPSILHTMHRQQEISLATTINRENEMKYHQTANSYTTEPTVGVQEPTTAPTEAPVETVAPTHELASGEFVVCQALVDVGCSEYIQRCAWEVTQYEYPGLVNYSLFLAQMYHESHWNPSAISSTDDYGIAQINICNLSNIANRLGCTVDEVKFDVRWNMRAAMEIWSDNINNYDRTNLAGYLMRYNMGPGGAAQCISSGTTTRYASGIINEDLPWIEGLLKEG